MWVNGWDFPTALRAVGDYLNLRSGATAPKRKTVPERKTVDEERQRLDDARARASLNRVWGESVPLSDPSAAPAREYLARRGIKMEAAALLRFHRALGYYEDGKLVGEYPAILAKISSSDGNPVTIHRIYLTPEGKLAPVGAPKKMIPFPFDRKVVGGAIRLTPLGVSKILAIAEGVETALAVAEGTELPVWSSVNALLIEKFSPPEGVKTVLVFADKDLSRRGQEAAKSLVQRLLGSGIDAVAVVPKGEIPDGQKSVDWLDILNRYGKPGFPTVGEILASCKLRRAA
jgi:hypothetical protein